MDVWLFQSERQVGYLDVHSQYALGFLYLFLWCFGFIFQSEYRPLELLQQGSLYFVSASPDLVLFVNHLPDFTHRPDVNILHIAYGIKGSDGNLVER